MDKKLRIGIIGCGMIARRLHAPDYATTPACELVALADPVRKNAEGIAAQWAPAAAIYSDYGEMLKKEGLDAVTVALPNVFHEAATIAALRAGCHVMVEKPMAASPVEAEHMVATARRLKKLLLVNQTQRLYGVHVKAKEVVESGILGKILTVAAAFGHAGPEHWSPGGKWFFKKKEARFGAMADLGVHKADLIRFVTGKEVAEISAYSGRLEKKGSDVEDNFVSCLRFSDGTLGTLSASWTTKGMDADYMILHCANGTLRINEIPGRPLVANLVKPSCEIVFEVPPPTIKYEGSWGLDVSGHFVRAILGEEAPFCTGAEAKTSLEIIFAAERSAATGRSVKIRHTLSKPGE